MLNDTFTIIIYSRDIKSLVPLSIKYRVKHF